MTKRKAWVAVVLAALLLCLAACSPEPAEPSAAAGSASAPSEAPAATASAAQTSAPIRDNLAGKTLNQFDVDVTLNTDSHQLTVKQTLFYYNATGKSLEEIFFHLIPNAFREDGGGVEVQSVTVDGEKAALEQAKGTVYEMALPSPLAAGDTAEICMDYLVKIPNIQNRFGYQENVYNVGNFIITPAVYEEDGWAAEPYVDLGDAFYTDIADYTVAIHGPEGCVIAAAGTLGEDGAYHAERVRDFVFCASDGFQTLRGEQDGTELQVFFSDNMALTAQRALDAAEKALALFNRQLGAYPYDTLTVVLGGLTNSVSGTEYPTLIMVGPEVSLEMLEQEGFATEAEKNGYAAMLDKTVAHEVAHQWFYGVVGSDQISYPWLDEGLCRFAEYLYEDAYPPDQPQPDFNISTEDRIADIYNILIGQTQGVTADLNQSLYDWVQGEPMDYGGIYEKGASLFYQMEQQMGKEAFREALRAYVDQFAYGFVTPETFFQFWNGQDDFSALFDLYFDSPNEK